MKNLRVLTVIGTRPEVIRLSCVIKKFDKFFEHSIVHTGQNFDYELNQIFFENFEIRQPDYFLNAAGSNGSQTIGKVIIEMDKLLDQIKPEAVLVLGDTNSCMALLPAKRRKIPTFHMEAGNRCFDQRVPEEINRRIVDHMADINLPYSTIARDYLIREGLPADMIIKTGSPMFEVLNEWKDKIDTSDILKKLRLKKNNFFVVSAHREENIEPKKNISNLIETLNEIAKIYKIPIIVSTHPRTKNRLNELKLNLNSLIQFSKPLGFMDYNKLQINAKAVLSDSGTINEESSILNFPALNIREAHERPEAMEEAVSIMTGLDKNRILQSLAILDSQLEENKNLIRPVRDYNIPNVSDKIVRIIYSYTDYVNRVVWKKY